MKRGVVLLFGLGLVMLPALCRAQSGFQMQPGATTGVTGTIGTITVTSNIPPWLPPAKSMRTTRGTLGPAGFLNKPARPAGLSSLAGVLSRRQLERQYSDRELRRMERGGM